MGKERIKTDRLVADSRERAYWRIHRPPPGCAPPLEPSPILSLRKTIAPTPNNSQVKIVVIKNTSSIFLKQLLIKIVKKIL